MTHSEEKEDYYTPKRVSSFWNNNYIEYKSNGETNNNLSPEEYLKKIKPYLSYIIIDLQKFDTWKIQLTMAINFILLKDAEKERAMHSRATI